MNKSSQFSSFKTNFNSEKRISLYKKSNEEKEPKTSNQVEKIKRNFSSVDTKPMHKSMTLNLNRNNPKEISDKSKMKFENENRIKFIVKNPISELTLENDLKPTIENMISQKTNFNKDKKHSNNTKEIIDYVGKIGNNNLDKFNLTKTKLPSSCNLKPYMSFVDNPDKNKNYFYLSNPNYKSQMNLTNPKINIRISNVVSEKIKNSKEYLTNNKGNVLYNPFSDNLNKNINININNNITNFYNMADLTAGYDDKKKMNKIVIEEEIQRKLAIYRTKLNSEMLRLLNEEKIKENDRQVLYENLKDNEEKYHFEKEVSNERFESSDKIVRMNQ